MNIKILGTRGEIEYSAPYHSKHSGILIDHSLLLDLGEKEFLKYQPQIILITHLHPDHAFFIRNPLEKLNIEAPIYAPEKYQNGITVHRLIKKMKLDPYEIIPLPTHHSHLVASQAYIIKKEQKKILYTGDMIWLDKKYHPLLKNLDLVITEASFIHPGGFIKKHPQSGKLYGHAGVPNLIKLFSQFTQNFILVHFGSWFYQNITESRKKFKNLAREYNINLKVGYDGMEFELRTTHNNLKKI